MHKLNTKHFVFTVTSFVVIVYLICAILTLIAPNLILVIGNQWAHAIDITKIAGEIPTILEIITGLITIAIATIIFSVIFVWLWNYFYEKLEVKK